MSDKEYPEWWPGFPIPKRLWKKGLPYKKVKKKNDAIELIQEEKEK